MEGDASKENGEHRHPLEILHQGCDQTLLAKTIPQDRETNIPQSREHNEEGNEDLPGIDVELVDIAVVPANKEVVQQGQGESKG